MKTKVKLTIIIAIVVIIIAISLNILYISLTYTKENAYKGHVEVLFLPDVSHEEIIDLSFKENLTIIDMENVTIAHERYIEVIYASDNYQEAEDIQDRLYEYDIVYDVSIYDEM